MPNVKFFNINIVIMKNSLTKWFPRMFPISSQKIDLQEQNKLLLRNDLKSCFTIDDICVLQTVCKLCAKDFSIIELMEFNLDVTYRIELIRFSDRFLHLPYYSVPEIAFMFRTAKSAFVCDAILLYLNKNKSKYLTNTRESLAIFESMAAKRIHAIKNAMFAHSA